MLQAPGSQHARRSSRVLVALALAVSGQKADGSHISGAAETIQVNRHGARIRSAVTLETKMAVRVAMLAPYKWSLAHVVWADQNESEYGIELDEPENFWGVYFPPEDWELQVPGTAEKSSAEASPSEPKMQPELVKPSAPLRIPEGGTVVTLRGLAATGMPFQERGLLVPVADSNGTILIGPLVNLGTVLTVILNKSNVEQAAVSAVAHSREYDRWRVWLNFDRGVKIT